MDVLKKILRSGILLCLMAYGLTIQRAAGQHRTGIENERYKVHVSAGGVIQLVSKSTSTKDVFLPKFTILYRKDDPGLRTFREDSLAFVVPGWKARDGAGITPDLFQAADTMILKAHHFNLVGNEVVWSFPPRRDFVFKAKLILPPGKQDPQIVFQLKAAKEGWYTVGYTGAPEIAPDAIEEIWQPLIWQERRFPQVSYLSAEFMCTIPAALVNSSKHTIGVSADPGEIPFRFPNLKNSRFGVMLRNAKGNAQPMVFAPLFGQAASFLHSGDTTAFQLRLIVQDGSVYDAYKYVATKIMGFHDYRVNTTCTLNRTIQNMVDYAMNDFYSGWNAALKAPDYSTDVKGTVKLVSALHPLSVAMIMDDEQIYRRRALPMMEYLMSREKYLFSEDTTAKHQSPSHYLKGPAAEVSELAALYLMSHKRSPVFRHYALDLYDKPRVLNLKMVSNGASWQNALALYSMTGQPSYLDHARAGADAYIAERIDRPQTDFSDVHIKSGGQFWTDFAPKWIDLLELYEATKEKRYLDAAVKGAQLFVEYIWMEPTPPDKEIRINKDGKVGLYAYQNRLNPDAMAMKAAEQKVPAWRVAQTGLISEASTTYVANRAVFLTHYAAYLLRLSYYTHDDFFRNIARAAVVGRYANFPGYSIMGEYTTIYGRPDYPLHSLKEMTYNNIYYNHIWPQIALLMDFLVADAFTRSNARIAFPHQYAQGYAYLQSDVYGDRKGVFYGDQNVQLWMPSKMLHTDNVQANYIAGYGNGNLYIALMNQSPEKVSVKVRLNADIIPFDRDKLYKVRLWRDNGMVERTTMKNGTLSVLLNGSGITAFAIDHLPVHPQFQGSITGVGHPHPEQSQYGRDTPLGKVTGMIIDMGSTAANAYIWLQATEKELTEVSLHYQEKGVWKERKDIAYPYEFSIPLADDGRPFLYWVEGTNARGEKLRMDTTHLER